MYLPISDDTGTATTIQSTQATPSLADVLDSAPVKTTGMALGVYHGYRRTGSLWWALIYGAIGHWKPVIGTAIALGQGFGEEKPCTCKGAPR